MPRNRSAKPPRGATNTSRQDQAGAFGGDEAARPVRPGQPARQDGQVFSQGGGRDVGGKGKHCCRTLGTRRCCEIGCATWISARTQRSKSRVGKLDARADLISS
jgi:hypothetical protein